METKTQSPSKLENRIVEIIEIGYPVSLIQREDSPISELINTNQMMEELNEQLEKSTLTKQ